jgi:hypothetical protein
MDWRSHIARYGQGWFPGEGWVRITALALLGVAAMLRSYRLHELPFTHDELSALVRLYPTLAETVQRGVIELDTHPPGVQVFEWFWTRAFGMSEFAVKLPFVLMSIAGLFLTYRSALAWLSAPAALISLSYLSTLQLSVMYGQIARPYAAGFFTIALLADQLTRYVAFGRSRMLVGVGIALVLSAYTHHFTLMLAAAIAATGLFLVRAEQRKAYLAMCGISALSYLPNIPIFLKQLALGGLDGWLTPPDDHWIVDHVKWLVHFSPILGALTGLLIAWSFARRLAQRDVATPATWFLPIWGLLPLVVGYAYSIWRSPVLQYSMLLFGIPFVLMALFAGMRGLQRTGTLLVCAAVVMFSTASLVFVRHHYNVFYTSRYEAMMEKAVELTEAHGPDQVLAVFDAPRPQVDLYAERYGLAQRGVHFVNLRKAMTPGGLDSLLVATRPRFVVLGISNGAESEDIARIQARLPYSWEQQDHVEGQVLVLGDHASTVHSVDRTLIGEVVPGRSASSPFVVSNDLPIIVDSTGRSLWSLDGREFGIECILDLPPDTSALNDLYEVIAETYAPAPHTDCAVVVELQGDDGRNSFYRSGDQNSYAAGSVTLVVAASPGWVAAPGKSTRLKAYLYNRGKSALRVGRVALYRRPVNPVQNALMTPIKDLGHRPE